MPLKSDDIRKMLEAEFASGEPLLLVMHRTRLAISKKIMHEQFTHLDANQLRFLRRADRVVATASLFRTETPSIVIITDLAPHALLAISEFRDAMAWLLTNWDTLPYKVDLGPVERKSMERIAAIADEQLIDLRASVTEKGIMIVPTELFETFAEVLVMGFQMVLGEEKTFRFGVALMTAVNQMIKQVKAMKKDQS